MILCCGIFFFWLFLLHFMDTNLFFFVIFVSVVCARVCVCGWVMFFDYLCTRYFIISWRDYTFTYKTHTTKKRLFFITFKTLCSAAFATSALLKVDNTHTHTERENEKLQRTGDGINFPGYVLMVFMSKVISHLLLRDVFFFQFSLSLLVFELLLDCINFSHLRLNMSFSSYSLRFLCGYQ